MDFQNILILVSVIVNLLLGFFILLEGKEKLKNILFAGIALSVSLWGVGMVLFRSASTVIDSIFWGKILYLAPIFIIISFLFFCYAFIYKKKKREFSKKIAAVMIILFGLFISYITLFTNKIISDVFFVSGQEKNIIFGSFYFPYGIFIAFVFVLGYFILLFNIKNSSGIFKKQLIYVFIGTFLASMLAMITNLILPSLGFFKLNWMGQIFSVIMTGFIAYATLKYRLFNIRVIATELFIFALWAVLALKTITADGVQDFLISGFILVATIFVGVFLLRSVKKEIKQREEIEKLVAKIEKANRKLRRIDKMKTEFMSIVSHQLRTPLSVIKGHLSMVNEGVYDKEPKRKTEILKDVYDANERLITLVNDVLNVSRIQAGRSETNKEEVDIVKVTEDMISKLLPSAEEKNIKLFIHYPKEKLPLLNIDVSKIENALLNLVDNAIKYTNEGSVELSFENKEDSLIIKIKDSGDGMNEEELEKLFETFSRGGAGKKYWIQGAGLGLYIARRFIEMHNGKVWAKSEGKEKGSEFYIKLPL